MSWVSDLVGDTKKENRILLDNKGRNVHERGDRELTLKGS
jgi:hypothetical protein